MPSVIAEGVVSFQSQDGKKSPTGCPTFQDTPGHDFFKGQRLQARILLILRPRA